MASPFLATDLTGASGSKTKSYNNATVSDIGVAFGASATGYNAASYPRPAARVARFGGSNANDSDTLISVSNNNIYRSTDEGATWSSVQALSSATTATGHDYRSKIGPLVITVDGIQTLVVIYTIAGNIPYAAPYSAYSYYNAEGTIGAYKSTDGITWTFVGPFYRSGYALNNSPTFGSVVTRGSSVYFTVAGPFLSKNTIAIIDFADESITQIYPPIANPAFQNYTSATASHQVELVIFNNALHAVCATNNGSYQYPYYHDERFIYKLIGSAWSSVATLETAAGNAFTYIGYPSYSWTISQLQFGAFVLNNFLYCVVWFDSTVGWRFYKVSSSYAVTDISTTVRPAGMVGSADTSRVKIVVDPVTTPGSAPGVLVLYAADGNAATTYTVYQWNGDASVMTSLGTGGKVEHAIGPSNSATSAGAFFTSGQNSVDFDPGVAPVPSGAYRQYGYRVWSPTGSATVKIRGWWGYITDEYPTHVMTFNSANGFGTLQNANTEIHSLTADGSAKTFLWDAIVDGASPANVIVLLEVFT